VRQRWHLVQVRPGRQGTSTRTPHRPSPDPPCPRPRASAVGTPPGGRTAAPTEWDFSKVSRGSSQFNRDFSKVSIGSLRFKGISARSNRLLGIRWGFVVAALAQSHLQVAVGLPQVGRARGHGHLLAPLAQLVHLLDDVVLRLCAARKARPQTTCSPPGLFISFEGRKWELSIPFGGGGVAPTP
jgi:hypothetical protein